jgi:hypothetical protein
MRGILGSLTDSLRSPEVAVRQLLNPEVREPGGR